MAAVAEGESREAREAMVDEDLTSAGRTGEGDLLAVERGGGVDEGAEEEAADVEGLGVDSRGGARAARRWLLDEGRLLEREANEAERRVGLGLSAAAAAMAADGDGEGVGEAQEAPALELRRGGAGRVDGDMTGAFETALGALGVMDDDADDEEFKRAEALRGLVATVVAADLAGVPTRVDKADFAATDDAAGLPATSSLTAVRSAVFGGVAVVLVVAVGAEAAAEAAARVEARMGEEGEGRVRKLATADVADGDDDTGSEAGRALRDDGEGRDAAGGFEGGVVALTAGVVRSRCGGVPTAASGRGAADAAFLPPVMEVVDDARADGGAALSLFFVAGRLDPCVKLRPRRRSAGGCGSASSALLAVFLSSFSFFWSPSCVASFFMVVSRPSVSGGAACSFAPGESSLRRGDTRGDTTPVAGSAGSESPPRRERGDITSSSDRACERRGLPGLIICARVP